MIVSDKAVHILRADFTEIIRFDVTDMDDISRLISSADFGRDGQVAFEDFLLFVSAFDTQHGQVDFDEKFDLDNDGSVGFPDLLIFVSVYGKFRT